MKKRIIFGLLMGAAMISLLWLDWHLTRDVFSNGLWQASPGAALSLRAVPLACLFLLLIVLAVRELKNLFQAAGIGLLPVSAIVATTGVALLPFWRQLVEPKWQGELTLLAVAVAVMLVFGEQMALRTTQDALRRIAATLLAVAYLGICGAMVLALRTDFNLPVLVLFLAAVKFTDIGAYFTGSFIGKHKLIPWLSPGKTWEGLAGGLITAGVVAIIVTLVFDVHLDAQRLTLPMACLFGVVVGLVGQFGDLSESMLKRATNLKDSGALVPEFGGLLDILDSPLLAAPAAYLLLTAMR